VGDIRHEIPQHRERFVARERLIARQRYNEYM